MRLDMAGIIYMYHVFIHGFGAFLFTLNWIRVGKVSPVYKYITFILWSATYSYACAAYARTLVGEPLHIWLDSWHWHTRLIPLAIGLTVFIGHMSYRFFIQRKNIEGISESK